MLRASGEDYLEAILSLDLQNPNVKSIDVAKILGVTRPSVNKAISLLKESGFVTQEPYGAIKLTEAGREMAVKIFEKHKLLSFFLGDILGVNYKTADEDACKIEHLISEETYEKLKLFVESRKEETL